ncbi:MAG: histidine kinase [Verrucomicrobiales bacterium]|nr:histidine kinase [Verrucomicrobiales bacterium]
MNILVVDDIATNRKLLKVTLEAEGHTSLEAADGVDALKILAHQTVDAVISDILMPNMDGFRLCHALRKSPQLHALPFIIYTATYTSPEDMKLAQTVGADKYITKPAPTSDILNALREVMDKKAARPMPVAAPVEEAYVLQQYSQALVNKLEEKNAELAEANQALKRTEERLRALTQRVVQAQEAEQGRVSRELHDTITQTLCAVLLRSQVLAGKLPAHNKVAKGEAIELCEMIGKTVDEVERISRNLRPVVLDQLGLVAGLHDASTEFTNQTGVSVKVDCVKLARRLPADTELALYRILQETLKNVEKHARARHVIVQLTKPGNIVQLTINDDGIGFDPDHHPAKRKGRGGLGLLGMRERATYVGGTFTVKSVRRGGTEIEIRIPVPPGATAAESTHL